MQTSIVRSVIVSAALVLAACSGAPTTTPLGSAPSQASAATTASEATVKPPPSIPTPTMQPALAGSRIVFYRDDGTFPPPAYLIGPDGTGEAVLPRDGIRPGAWSPDGTMLAGPQLSGAGGTVDEEWFRPAVMRPDGSGFLVLDAYPDRRLNLVPVGWSADGARVFVFSGYDATDIDDVGLFSVRASDGGDIRSVIPSPHAETKAGRSGDPCARPDFVQASRDGRRLLINRMATDACGVLLVADADGTHIRRINPEGTVSVDLEFGDFVERPRFSEAWSPDLSQIAFGAFVTAADSTALFVADADGGDARQIVPTSVGAVTAQWSPDGTWIAFTSRLRAQPQVWLVHPDGTGLIQVTDGKDGSTSVGPVWSPDGSKLLFERGLGGRVTLWTMNVDGTEARPLSTTPVGDDYVGPYAWWAAPKA